MKLSNKILIGFFGFVFLYLSAAFVEVRLTGSPNVVDDKNSIAETVDLSGITYVVLKDLDKNVKVIGSDRSQLEVRSLAGDFLKKLQYKVSGDTLTLSGLQSQDIRTVTISVFVPNTTLKGITVNSAVARIEGFQQEFLHISQNSGSIWMTDSRISKIEMDLNHAYLDISGTNLDTVSVRAERSTVNISSPVGILQGSIKNGAFLHLYNLEEIQLKKDESSKLSLY
jgi:hypothetical protein